MSSKLTVLITLIILANSSCSISSKNECWNNDQSYKDSLEAHCNDNGELSQISKAKIREKHELKSNLHNKVNESIFRFYIERENLTTQLNELIRKEQFILIQATAGMGKTTLAYKYAASRLNEFEAVIWFDSESYSKIEFEILEIAEEIGLSTSIFRSADRMNNVIAGQEEAAKNDWKMNQIYNSIVNYLGEKKTQKFLFVFDNLVDLEDHRIVSLFDQLKRASNLKFLITTRNNLLKGPRYEFFNDYNTIEINYFSEKEINEYLDAISRNLFSQQSLSIKTKWMCFNNMISPYTLNRLRIYLNELHVKDRIKPIKDYLHDVCHNVEKIKLKDPLFNSLMDKSKDAWLILQYSAFLDSDFINMEIIEHLNIKNISDSLLKLEKQGIISIIRPNHEYVGLKVWHRNFQKEIREFIEICKPINQCLNKSQTLLNLILTINKIFQIIDKKDYYEDKVLKYIINIERLVSDVREIENFEKNLNIGNIINILGEIKKNQGKYNEALKYYKQALEIYKNSLPKYHPDIAKSYNNIGFLYYSQGNYDKAMTYYDKSLAIYKKSFPTDHPDIAIPYNNLGLIFIDQGNPDESLFYFNISLVIRKKTLSSDDPDIAISYNNIGNVNKYLGKYEKSLEYYKKSLEIYKKSPLKNHPDITYTYDNIGFMYLHFENYSNAWKYINKSMEIRKKLLPKDHPDIANSYCNIGFLYYYQGNYNEALELYNLSLEIYNKSFPSAYLKIARIFRNCRIYNVIGLAYYLKGKLKESYDSFIQKIEIAKKNHSSITIACFHDNHNLGYLYFDKGSYDDALNIYSLEMSKGSLPPDHPVIGTSYNFLGIWYYKKGNYDESLKYYNKSLEIRKKYLQPNHSTIAILYNSIGDVYYRQRKYDQALKFYKQSLKIRIKLFPYDPILDNLYHRIYKIYLRILYKYIFDFFSFYILPFFILFFHIISTEVEKLIKEMIEPYNRLTERITVRLKRIIDNLKN